MKKVPDIILRAIEPEDLDILYKVENDISLWGVGVTNVPYSRYMLHDYIASAVGDIYTDKQVRLMIENSERKIVGIVDIIDFDPRHMRAELGIVILCEYRRQGYAAAAVHKAISYARQILHLHQLYVFIDEENKISLDFFEKVGFECSATLKDWLFTGKKYKNAVLMQYFYKKTTKNVAGKKNICTFATANETRGFG